MGKGQDVGAGSEDHPPSFCELQRERKKERALSSAPDHGADAARDREELRKGGEGSWICSVFCFHGKLPFLQDTAEAA